MTDLLDSILAEHILDLTFLTVDDKFNTIIKEMMDKEYNSITQNIISKIKI